MLLHLRQQTIRVNRLELLHQTSLLEGIQKWIILTKKPKFFGTCASASGVTSS